MLSRVLRFLFPPHCVICGREGSDLCAACRIRLVPSPFSPGEDTVALFPYADPSMKAIIHAYKYKKKRELAAPLASLLAREIERFVAGERAVFVPIPPSGRLGGFDHIGALARSVMKEVRNVPPIGIRPILEKTRRTARQVEMKDREARLKNLVGAFKALPYDDAAGATFILLDDVTTTGATFAEARRALSPLRPKRIFALALAH